MKKRNSLLIGLSVFVVGCLIYVNSGNQAEREAARLLKKAEQAESSLLEDQGDHSAHDPSHNAPIPEDFVVSREPGRLWFVEKPGTEQEVSLPYPPQEIPSPAKELASIGKNPGFVGADACQECHESRHASFTHTAHYRTSARASRASIAGSFEDGKNEMKTGSPFVSFKMIERDARLFQSVSFYGWQCDVPMDIVTGSSKLGQSYLFWHDDALFQTSVSYVTSVDDWTNSPGYPDGYATYSRPVTARCLECHTTWADVREAPNHFTPESVIYGISCERCHGPGQQHVQYHQANPSEKTSRFIAQPASLPRQRQLDICGQCHFGIPKLKDEPYQFRPGDQLSDHYEPPPAKPAGGVHSSNQLTRLLESPCFNQTEMTCTDCHNPHQSERGNRKLFSERCLKCHQPTDCGMEPTLGARLADNCIDCHMPAGASENMSVDTSEGTVFPPLRDHHIRVDRDATRVYLESLAQ
ncbi:MAG: hypothetical protein KDB00_18885 [Planctomycetales bacterium]|nr:hypothetical protein [Planctomycetales bacterium]